jgi:hypothetical protein
MKSFESADATSACLSFRFSSRNLAINACMAVVVVEVVVVVRW